MVGARRATRGQCPPHDALPDRVGWLCLVVGVRVPEFGHGVIDRPSFSTNAPAARTSSASSPTTPASTAPGMASNGFPKFPTHGRNDGGGLGRDGTVCPQAVAATAHPPPRTGGSQWRRSG